jgi:hypothetical protein
MLKYEVKENEMSIACSTRGEKKAHRILMGKPEGKRLMRRSKRRWEDNIKCFLEK